jgi:hypothetical protein
MTGEILPCPALRSRFQRIINHGGHFRREYGLSRRRTDIDVEWPWPGGMKKVVIELKILRGSLEKTLELGLRQTLEYQDRCGGAHPGASEAHLVVFVLPGSLERAPKDASQGFVTASRITFVAPRAPHAPANG